MDPDCLRINDFSVIVEAYRASAAAAGELGIMGPIEIELDRGGVEGGAIVKLHAGPQFEGIDLPVG